MKKIIIVVLMLLLGSCASPTIPGSETNRLAVVTTSYPVAQFVEHVGKELVEVNLITKGSSNTHTYDPTPKDLLDMNEAVLLFYTNEAMEPWIDGLKLSLKETVTVVDTSVGIDFIQGHDHGHEENHDDSHEELHGFGDPHIWTSMKNAQIMVSNIEQALIDQLPEEKATIQVNAQAYQAQLKQLDQEYETVFQQANQQKLVFLGHFAFNYLLRDYAFDYTVLYESLSHESEPTAVKVKEVIDYIQEENLRYVFKEELADDRIVEAVLETTEALTLELHGAHVLSSEDLAEQVSFIQLQQRNIENLRVGLQ